MLVVVGSLPIIMALPFVGVVMFSWISYMNPHRLAPWGFVYDMPLAALVAATTLVAYLISREPKRIPWNGITVVWILFIAWMNLTTVFALYPDSAWPQWEKVMKIQFMALVSLGLLTNRRRIDLLVWIIVLSIGFYGVKGGLFTLLTGGEHRVWGPPQSFIGGNNEIAFAMLLVIPLMRYLQLTSGRLLIRLGLGAAMLLSAVAVLGSYSRGAFLAAGAIGLVLWWKSRYRIVLGAGIACAVVIGLMLMPPEWFVRMETIQDYEQDRSAMGRINSWWFAFYLALDRPVGGGFETFMPDLFQLYAPDPTNFKDAHSIYFEMLGEHGFVGLFLFLVLGATTWYFAYRLQRGTRGVEGLRWASDLGAMIQVSLVGYGVGGAFLGLAYFDLVYHLIAITVAARALAERQLRDGIPEVDEGWLESLRPPARDPSRQQTTLVVGTDLRRNLSDR